MHVGSVGVSKFCFLLSLVFCGLLLLLIPALQPSVRQVDPPQPRPQVKLARAGKGYTSDHTGAPTVSTNAWYTGWPTRGQERLMQTEDSRNDNYSLQRRMGFRRDPDRVAMSGLRTWDQLELKDIFIAVKTTRKYHKSRLELLVQTWVSQAKEQLVMR